ncbi:broad-complex core protein isoform X1 [Anopheles stephensi]|uniref:broad-complex core protein isoform X1 n=1 Tax=Anopheles stephensi TaxID=30069 RepID=UPI001658AAF0|nr:broad-complex core protein isoform X1 [Anopheles stephensi]XP_035895011.1 broad-complex core protein isoform X1 [Anopheles stephensi]XP_035895012.1 broad-complex core protein isoform X1 [Anopheles stephensi]XP_035895013.1 broad-complex core protein isoform X1 [Anopheles stephensi]XP_035895015.1 broad-complex core protein isoform X1 [Anopheles stephensi]XP_035895016.1 broad-complex core protein isoform X1 [Anopheles stephensi]XP_035895017.1 broad-complex core protein isoform X1 [Anopheles s
MVDTQHFCLRWNNYQSSITSAFENLRDDEDFVDVTLACDGRSLKAHRVVLSACSTYFRELLKSTPCKHPVIVLQDVAFTDLHALVEFIYHGEVNVHQRSLSSFLKTAEILRVSGLTQQQAEETHGIHTSLGANLPSGVVHHPIYPDKMLDDSLYVSQGASPPPHLANLHNSSSPSSGGGGGGGGGGGSGNSNGAPMVNQLLKRAAAAAALRRERNNSAHSDEMALKRHRMSVDSNGPTNARDLDVICSTPQTTATDFSSSASKQHINLPSPQGKDQLRQQDSLSGHANSGNNNSFSINSSSNLIKSSINNNNNNINNNNNLNNNLLHSKENSSGGGTVGGGLCGSGSMPTSLGTSNGSNAGSLCSAEKESLASSPSERSAEDVKSEPLELLCGTGGDHENSSDSVTDDHGDLVKRGLDVKGSLRSPNDHELDSNMHHHSGAQFLMNASENKLFPTPPQFNFSMAALAADPAALAGFSTQALQAVELAGSPQGMSIAASMASQRSASPPDGGSHGGHGGHGGINRLSLPLPLAACHRCDVCGKLLSTKLTLKRHKEQQHLQPLNNAVCNLCHKVFRTLNSLNNHKSIYHRRQKILHHHHHAHLHGQHPFAAVAAAVGGGGGGAASPLHHGTAAAAAAAAVAAANHELLNNNAGGSDCDIKHSVATKLEYM